MHQEGFQKEEAILWDAEIETKQICEERKADCISYFAVEVKNTKYSFLQSELVY